MSIIQCVPNFSEGRDESVVKEIVNAIESVKGVRLLDYSSDTDHNRTVVTFVGDKESVLEGAFQGAQKAQQLIDMTKHSGEHPRMGATDVVPFIPIKDATMEDCEQIANKLGQRMAEELEIPVFFVRKSCYGKS